MTFKLTVNGTDITSTIADRIVSITVTDERDGNVDQLDIEISNNDYQLKMPEPKAQLQLWLADDSGTLIDMGEYHVDTTELSGRSRIIHITARSADITESLRVRREISYQDTTLGDILQQIALRNGLTAVVASALASIGLDHFDQAGESDLAFIQRLGELYDAVAVVKAGRVLFKPAGTGTTTNGNELPPVVLEFDGIDDDWRLRLENSSYTGVTGYWNDDAGAKRHKVSVGTDVYPLNINGTFRTKALCESAVNSRWQQLQRAQSNFNASFRLNPHALPDAPLQFTGNWPEEVTSREFIVRRVVHSFPVTTSIEAELKTV